MNPFPDMIPDPEWQALHEATRAVLGYFAYSHLSAPLSEVSAPFADLAIATALRTLNGASGPETTVALRKLLEGKDAAVRAALAINP